MINRIPIIAITDDLELREKNKTARKIVNNILVKPFKPSLLEESILKIMSEKKKNMSTYNRFVQKPAQMNYSIIR